MEPILFYSTNDPQCRQPGIPFAEALMRGLAPDKGLYMIPPGAIPRLGDENLEAFATLPYPEIASRVLFQFLEGDMDRKTLSALCADAYDFDVPIEHWGIDRWILRLDRGPTASFKDFAARMMARLMAHFLGQRGGRATILTATSGDTGGAVAAAFHRLDNIQVIVLYPAGEVSERQRRQMTTLGHNVTAVEVQGKFDDCQALVKQAFVDPDLADLDLTSANSINVGRLIPQSVYYFQVAARVRKVTERPVLFCVPSGNFGNLMGGLLAKRMGAPIARFLAAVNENDEFPQFLRHNAYAPVAPSRNCLSNAMNVGHPSNLARLVALYGGAMDERGALHQAPDMNAIHRDILSVEVTDAQTRQAIARAWEDHQTLIEPHGAVGFAAMEQLGVHGQYATVLLETAHPAKFPEVVTEMTGVEPDLPAPMAAQQGLEETRVPCSGDYGDFKDLVRSAAGGA